MATTRLGARMTEQHRQTQNGITATFLARFLALWPLLNPRRLDDTRDEWVAAVMPVLRVARQDSADAATLYYRQFRDVESPDAPPVRIEPEFTGRPSAVDDLLRDVRRVRRSELLSRRVDTIFDEPSVRAPTANLVKPRIDWSDWDEAAEKSLQVVGPGRQKRATAAGRTPQQAQNAALVEASGAASRHVRDGGRIVLDRLVGADKAALGYIRVLGPNPCYFCAMLASRGPVFKERSFLVSDARFLGEGREKVHDHCACTIEPVYAEGTSWPGRAEELAALWRTTTRGLSGRDATNAFRRAFQARRLNSPALTA